jgi:8-oxo-dGTP diphosphatase
MPVIGQDDAALAKWWPLSSLPKLAFDHDEIISDAIALYHALVQ